MLNLALYKLIQFAQLIDGGNIELPNKNITDTSLQNTIGNVLSIVFGVLGAISVLVITIAGLQYILSGGDPQKTAKAKDTILYAVIGLAVAVLAFSIVRFVLERAV